MQRTPPSAAVARTMESLFSSSLNFLPLAFYFSTLQTVKTALVHISCPVKFPGGEKAFLSAGKIVKPPSETG
jgi:hypothetical protein